MPEQDLVLIAIERGIARVTLNRPDRLNALDHDLAVALATTFEGLERDPTLRAVTLMGAGRAFMAGGDIAVGANVLVFESALRGDVLWGARVEYVLRRRANGFGMARKKVVLVNNDKALYTLSFLI